MIEHFKKFDRGDKSLLPLSFSHLNEFAFYRERWALRGRDQGWKTRRPGKLQKSGRFQL